MLEIGFAHNGVMESRHSSTLKDIAEKISKQLTGNQSTAQDIAAKITKQLTEQDLTQSHVKEFEINDSQIDVCIVTGHHYQDRGS